MDVKFGVETLNQVKLSDGLVSVKEGFECVAAADAAGGFELAELSSATRAGLDRLFRHLRLEAVVGTRNPLDVTPIADDSAFAEAAELIVTDPQVDVAMIGCVPLTGALETLPSAGDGGLAQAGSVASRLGRLWAETDKAWVVVIDAGPLYDPLAGHLEALGIPTFRSADRALRLVERYVGHRRMVRHLADAAAPPIVELSNQP